MFCQVCRARTTISTALSTWTFKRRLRKIEGPRKRWTRRKRKDNEIRLNGIEPRTERNKSFFDNLFLSLLAQGFSSICLVARSDWRKNPCYCTREQIFIAITVTPWRWDNYDASWRYRKKTFTDKKYRRLPVESITSWNRIVPSTVSPAYKMDSGNNNRRFQPTMRYNNGLYCSCNRCLAIFTIYCSLISTLLLLLLLLLISLIINRHYYFYYYFYIIIWNCSKVDIE